jgi:hypothetical protein
MNKADKQVSYIEAFKAMQCFLEKHYMQTRSEDIGSLLSDMQFITATEIADPAAWNDWMTCIKSVKSKGNSNGFNSLDAYQAMLCFLDNYYQLTQSADIGSLLGGLVLIEDNRTRDPAAWDDWMKCIDKMRGSKE